MRVNSIKYWLMISIFALHSCSGAVVSGDTQKKEPKKRADESKTVVTPTHPDSEDAIHPQVVTGGYLACTPDNGSSRSGEAGYGCGIYDGVTDEKIELGSSKLVLSAATSGGAAVASRLEDDDTASKYHGHIYVSSSSQNDLVIQALLTNSGVADRSFKTRIVKLSLFGAGSGTDPFSVEKDYTPAELSAWCANMTTKPFSGSYQNQIDFGTACGADFLSSKSTDQKVLASFIALLTKVGICEKPGVTSNQTANVERCKK